MIIWFRVSVYREDGLEPVSFSVKGAKSRTQSFRVLGSKRQFEDAKNSKQILVASIWRCKVENKHDY